MGCSSVQQVQKQQSFQKIPDSLKCYICSKLYKDPVIISTKSVYCRNCINQILYQAQPTCPKTKMTITDIKTIPNIYINNTIKKSYKRQKQLVKNQIGIRELSQQQLWELTCNLININNQDQKGCNIIRQICIQIRKSQKVMIKNANKSQMQIFSLVIKQNKNIKQLHVQQIQQKYMALLLQSISNNYLFNNISIITFAKCIMSLQLCKILQKCFKTYHINLTCIRFIQNQIDDQKLQILLSFICRCKNMKQIVFSKNLIQQGTIKLFNTLSKFTLTKLNISYNKVGDDALKILSQQFKFQSMVQLYLDGCQINQKRLKFLINILNKSKKLQVLSISNNQLNDQGIINLTVILKSLPQLRQLNIHKNNLFPKGISSIKYAQFKNLEKLNISNNMLGYGSKLFCSVLKQLKSLKVLDVSNCKMNAQQFDNMIELLKLINLKQLYIVNNVIKETHYVQILNIIKSKLLFDSFFIDYFYIGQCQLKVLLSFQIKQINNFKIGKLDYIKLKQIDQQSFMLLNKVVSQINDLQISLSQQKRIINLLESIKFKIGYFRIQQSNYITVQKLSLAMLQNRITKTVFKINVISVNQEEIASFNDLYNNKKIQGLLLLKCQQMNVTNLFCLLGHLQNNKFNIQINILRINQKNIQAILDIFNKETCIVVKQMICSQLDCTQFYGLTSKLMMSNIKKVIGVGLKVNSKNQQLLTEIKQINVKIKSIKCEQLSANQLIIISNKLSECLVQIDTLQIKQQHQTQLIQLYKNCFQLKIKNIKIEQITSSHLLFLYNKQRHHTSNCLIDIKTFILEKQNLKKIVSLFIKKINIKIQSIVCNDIDSQQIVQLQKISKTATKTIINLLISYQNIQSSIKLIKQRKQLNIDCIVCDNLTTAIQFDQKQQKYQKSFRLTSQQQSKKEKEKRIILKTNVVMDGQQKIDWLSKRILINSLTINQITQENIQGIVNLASKYNQIKQLKLILNIQQYSSTIFTNFQSIFFKLNSLEVLCIQSNKDQYPLLFRNLIKDIKKHNKLKRLKFVKLPIDKIGMKQLNELILQLRYLKNLQLINCDINNEIGLMLSQVLKKNKSLQKIDLRGNEINQKHLDKIIEDINQIGK